MTYFTKLLLRNKEEQRTPKNRTTKNRTIEMDFKCSLCPKKFSLKQGLKRHIQEIHEKSVVICRFCPQQFFHMGELANHVKQDHYEKGVHECTLCHKLFTSTNALCRHSKEVHQEISTRKCHFCECTFSCDRNLKAHVKKSHEFEMTQKPRKLKCYGCDICEMEFSSVNVLKHHIKKVHEKPKKKKTRQLPSSQDLETTADTGNYVCIQCNEAFHSSEKLAHHIKTVHISEKKVCFKCQPHKEFKQQKTLVNHTLKEHFKILPVKCEFCAMTFPSTKQYHEHANSEHKMKIKCDMCHSPFMAMIECKSNGNTDDVTCNSCKKFKINHWLLRKN